jgi:signal peptidase II
MTPERKIGDAQAARGPAAGLVVARAWRWLALALVIIALDQLTKMAVREGLVLYEVVPVAPAINLTRVHNTGAAFSFLNDAGGWQRWLFVGLAFAVSAGIVVWLLRHGDERLWYTLALTLVLGGAIGNLCDRLTLGYVIDFIDVYYDRWHWPAFNVADSAISIGAVLLLLDALRRPG